MNKHLLLGCALLAAISAFPQAGKQVPVNAPVDKGIKTFPVEKESVTTIPVSNTVKPTVKHKTLPTAAGVSAVTAKWISGSHNVFGVIVSESKPLQYNKSLNAISFVHRASVTYIQGMTNGNSGTIAAWLSTNSGTTWDSTAIWEHTTNLARYPQGGIYNFPANNTNMSNAYIVGMGPITGGSGWLGNWYCSKQLNAFNKTPGTDQQSKLNSAATTSLNVHQFSRLSFNSTNDGLVRSVSTLMGDPAGTTYAAQAVRGAGLVKGVFNAGAFVWSMDSVLPTTLTRADGSKLMEFGPIMAWAEDGITGYVIFFAVNAAQLNATTLSYQPMVYKTTTSGSSWSLLPTNDWTTPAYQRMIDRLWSVSSNTNLVVPLFTSQEGYDATVDVNGQLHIATTVRAAAINHKDSLNYYTPWKMGSFWQHVNLGWPYIYDFHTTPAGTWRGIIIDSMSTEGASGGTTASAPGHTANPWVDATSAGNKIDLSARIQIGRSPNGRQIFYSWTESDTLATSHNWNIYPDIKMRGYDVTTDKMTPRVNITTGVLKADQTAYFHYMSNKPIELNACGSFEMPFTISYNGAKDGGIPVEHYYLQGASIACAQYTAPSVPLGIEQKDSKTTAANYEVTAYPNPASDIATVSVILKEAKNFELSVYNTVGQLIKTIKIVGVEGANDIDLDLTKLNAGIYMYSVKVDNAVITKKLIKQ